MNEFRAFVASADIKTLIIFSLIACIYILFDIFTGVFKAMKCGNFKSCHMKDGLWKKLGSLLVILFAVTTDLVQMYFAGKDYLPITIAVCSLISVMESASIIENICIINPDLMPERLFEIFGLTEKVAEMRAKKSGKGGEDDVKPEN